jgi:hypothetical protein
MVSWLKRLIGIPADNRMTAFLHEAEHAREMLDAAGREVPDTRAELRKAIARSEALGALKLKEIDRFRTGQGLIDRDVSLLVSEAIGRYADEMAKALSTVALDEKDAASREGRVLTARRVLAASVPVPLTPAMVREMDRALGLPPVDPTLGLPAAE